MTDPIHDPDPPSRPIEDLRTDIVDAESSHSKANHEDGSRLETPAVDFDDLKFRAAQGSLQRGVR